MKKKNKTQRRAEWLIKNRDAIEASRTTVTPNKGVTVGMNARYYQGMSAGGMGWWVRAFDLAGIDCNPMNYWSGSAPTPSIAINLGIARFIWDNAPDDLK